MAFEELYKNLKIFWCKADVLKIFKFTFFDISIVVLNKSVVNLRLLVVELTVWRIILLLIADLHGMTTFVTMSVVFSGSMNIFKTFVLIWEAILPIIDNFTVSKFATIIPSSGRGCNIVVLSINIGY